MNNNESKIEDQEAVSEFRSLIRETDMNYKMEDGLLLCFLRARKYDLDRAFKLLKNYVKMVKKYPDLFTDLRVERMAHISHLTHHLLASPVRDQNGHRVIIINARDWDYSIFTIEDGFRGILMTLQRIVDNVKNQMRGVVIIFDFKDFSIYQVRQFTPSYMKKVSDLFQDAFPIRIKGFHIVNEPWVFKYLVGMIWPFLSYKIRSRLFFHGNYFESLHQHVGPACLPSDYDGQLGPMVKTMQFSEVFPESNYTGIFDCFN